MLAYSVSLNMRRPREENKKEELDFKRLVTDSGSSKEAADEIWKWFDPSNKKGAASF